MGKPEPDPSCFPPKDAGVPKDTGSVLNDAGLPVLDGTTPKDSASVGDNGTAKDAGGSTVDKGTNPADSGSSTPDSGGGSGRCDPGIVPCGLPGDQPCEFPYWCLSGCCIPFGS